MLERARCLLGGSRERISRAIVELTDLPRVEPILSDLDDRAAQQRFGKLFNRIPDRLGPGGEAAIAHGSARGALARTPIELGMRMKVERNHVGQSEGAGHRSSGRNLASFVARQFAFFQSQLPPYLAERAIEQFE